MEKQISPTVLQMQAILETRINYTFEATVAEHFGAVLKEHDENGRMTASYIHIENFKPTWTKALMEVVHSVNHDFKVVLTIHEEDKKFDEPGVYFNCKIEQP